MTYLVGKVALDITAGAPNNGEGQNNVGVVKQLRVGRDIHPYVSAQAFRRWIRDSVPGSEHRSPVTAEGRGPRQQAYTAGRPDLYLDDDLFGYMVAVRRENFQRDTVFATGTLVSVAPRRPVQDFGTMSRGFPPDAHPVIHQHELYSAELAGDVLLDLPRAGTFEQEGGGLRRALSAEAATQALGAGAQQVTFRDVVSIQLPLAERKRRVAVLLRTLAEVRGGAQNALHYGDRTPAFVLLAPVKAATTRSPASSPPRTARSGSMRTHSRPSWRRGPMSWTARSRSAGRRASSATSATRPSAASTARSARGR